MSTCSHGLMIDHDAVRLDQRRRVIGMVELDPDGQKRADGYDLDPRDGSEVRCEPLFDCVRVWRDCLYESYQRCSADSGQD